MVTLIKPDSLEEMEFWNNDSQLPLQPRTRPATWTTRAIRITIVFAFPQLKIVWPTHLVIRVTERNEESCFNRGRWIVRARGKL